MDKIELCIVNGSSIPVKHINTNAVIIPVIPKDHDALSIRTESGAEITVVFSQPAIPNIIDGSATLNPNT